MTRTVVSLIRNLQRRNSRRRQPLAVLEGVRLCEEALAANVPFEGVAVGPTVKRSERGLMLLETLRDRDVPIETVADQTIRDIADTDSPQGVVAVVDPPTWSFDDVQIESNHPILVLDSLQDPGNVGTILRTAFALGAAAVVCLPGTVQLTHPKLLRSSLGASLRFPVVVSDVDTLVAWTSEQDVGLWIAAADGAPIGTVTFPDRLGIIVGNEGAGVRQDVAAITNQRIAIPMLPHAESLNVAAAAAILLYEATR